MTTALLQVDRDVAVNIRDETHSMHQLLQQVYFKCSNLVAVGSYYERFITHFSY